MSHQKPPASFSSHNISFLEMTKRSLSTRPTTKQSSRKLRTSKTNTNRATNSKTSRFHLILIIFSTFFMYPTVFKNKYRFHQIYNHIFYFFMYPTVSIAGYTFSRPVIIFTFVSTLLLVWPNNGFNKLYLPNLPQFVIFSFD